MSDMATATINFEIRTSKFRRFIALVLIRLRFWIDEIVITSIKVNGKKVEPIKIKDLIKEYDQDSKVVD